MKIAVASGKGGTGKTTIAVSLVLSLANAAPLFLDCDVEEPDAALFLHPKLTERQVVTQPVPEVNAELCTACGTCAEVCRYHAIAAIGEQILVFPELCHGCGSCTRRCPTGAIREIPDPIGVLERGQAGPIAFAQGTLNVGEAMAVPVIRRLKRWAAESHTAGPTILDAPPGASCPVVETLRGADAVLLVTEPTPYGLHDLRVAVKAARDELGLPVAVVVNRDGVGDSAVYDYCAAEAIPILLRIPLERAVAEAIAEGTPLVNIRPQYRDAFRTLYTQLTHLAGCACPERV